MRTELPDFARRMPQVAETTDDGLTPEAVPDNPELDAESFEQKETIDDPAQDLDDADPTAPSRPAFPEERKNEERGNRGPAEEPGFGQGA